MKELETNQIIQAFEHMVKNADNHIPITGKMLLEDVFEVLKRQQAEIEQLRQLFVESGKEQDRLMAEIERLNAVSEICGDCHKKYAEKIQTAKSEAIKEFAERLEDELGEELLINTYPFIGCAIDNVAKEMTEQVNG